MKRLFFLAIVALAISGVTIAQEPAERGAVERRQKDTRAGSITGRAINDSGQPIANAVVMVNKISSRPESRNALTDEAGSFRVDGLSSGLYNVFVRAPGYIDARDRSRPSYMRPGESVTVTMIKGGVITGMVTNPDGEPVVGVTVSALRVRDLDGIKIRYSTPAQPRQTDDRGVYRIYGLPPGVYLVSTSRLNYSSPASPFAYEMPVYYPSATIDTAAEVSVRSGEEASNIDIRYRSIQGHAVSGHIVGAPPVAKANNFYSNTFSVALAYPSNGLVCAQATTNEMAGNSFVIEGVPDGEYVLIARRFGNQEDVGAISPRIRVTVKGSDVTSLKVPVAPYALVSGRVVIEPMRTDNKAKCETKQPGAPSEIMIYARPDQTNATKDSIAFPIGGSQAVPDEAGEFKLLRLEAGQIHIAPELMNEGWYVRAITIAQPPQSKPIVDVARFGLAIKPGERVTGLTIAIAEGAASLRGRIVAAEGATINERLRVHLVPVETSLREDTLRYAEAEAQSDGSFTIKNLAPGRYWIIARPAPDTGETIRKPVAQDATTRTNLRREAEAANVIVELQSCQRAGDYQLRYPSLAGKPAAK